MNRIEGAFHNKKAFIGFLTAGDGGIEKTQEYIAQMEVAGADLIEIGIPFSDPVAEGSVIEAANIRALEKGTNVTQIFEMVARIRTKSQIPLVFLTYSNPVYHYGYDAFFEKCQACGVDGIIIPDLPFEESEEIRGIANRYGVTLISLIAPTSKERIASIARRAEGFVYVVSSMGVTGVRNEIQTDLKTIIAEVKKHTSVKVAVGFGISTQEQAKEIAEIADGVIVGSAIVKVIAEHGLQASDNLYQYVKTMKTALK